MLNINLNGKINAKTNLFSNSIFMFKLYFQIISNYWENVYSILIFQWK